MQLKEHPKPFPTPTGNTIVTHDFIDIASGTAYITLFGGNTKTDYHLTSYQYYSDVIGTNVTPGITTDTKEQDIDFDVTTNNSMTLEGTAIINLVLSAYAAGSTGDVSTYAILKLRKWDGTTETEIANATTQTLSNTTDDTSKYLTTAVNLTIPRTRFKKGDTIRITVEQYATIRGNSVCKVGIVNDPKGRAIGDAETSVFCCFIPVLMK